MFYLFLYIHVVGCLFWTQIERDAPEVFYKDINRGYYYPLFDFDNGAPFHADPKDQYCPIDRFGGYAEGCMPVEADPQIDRRFGNA